MTAPVQAVTFDLWQTLMHDAKPAAQERARLRAEGMHRALTGAGRRLPLEEVEAACRDIWHEWQTRYWDHHVDPGFEAQMAWLRNRLQAPDGPDVEAALRAAYIDPIFAVPPQVDPEAVDAARCLAEAGLRLGLISNTSVTPGFALRRLLDGWGLDGLLPVQLYSDEMGMRKPRAAVFRRAAGLLEVDVSELLHIGDRPDFDVQGALDAGARALHRGPDTSLRQLAGTITSNRITRPSGQGAA